MSDLYQQDYCQWFSQQASLLRAGQWDRLDVSLLADELEDMGKREKRALRSRTVVLLGHLLKFAFQPEQRGPSWTGTIREQRKQLAGLLADSPSLRPLLSADLQDCYVSARLLAAGDTGLPEGRFPSECPFTLTQLLDEHYWPEADGGNRSAPSPPRGIGPS